MPATYVVCSQLSNANVRPAAVVSAATDVSAAVDITGYDGVIGILLTLGAVGPGTVLPKVTTCATSGGSYADVPGATIAAAVSTANTNVYIPVDTRACLQFIKLSTVVGGTSVAFGASLVGIKKVTG